MITFTYNISQICKKSNILSQKRYIHYFYFLLYCEAKGENTRD